MSQKDKITVNLIKGLILQSASGLLGSFSCQGATHPKDVALSVAANYQLSLWVPLFHLVKQMKAEFSAHLVLGSVSLECKLSG